MSVLAGPVAGLLTVTFHRGLNLFDTNSIGKQDPYCKLTLGKETQKTKVHSNGGKNPTWNQALLINIDSKDLRKDIVKIEVYDKETISDDFIGQTSIFLKDFVGRPGKNTWTLTKSSSSNDSRGDLELTVDWKQTGGTPIGVPQQQQQQQQVQQQVQHQPVPQQPVYQQPVQHQPVQPQYVQPVQQQPQYTQPVYKQPVQQQQQHGGSGYSQPVQQQGSGYSQPVQQQQGSGYSQPVQHGGSGYSQPVQQQGSGYSQADNKEYELSIYEDEQGRLIDAEGNQVNEQGQVLVPANQVTYINTTTYVYGQPNVYMIGGRPRYMRQPRHRIRFYGRGRNRVVRGRRGPVMNQHRAAVSIQANFRGLQVRKQQRAMGRPVVRPVHRARVGPGPNRRMGGGKGGKRHGFGGGGKGGKRHGGGGKGGKRHGGKGGKRR